MWFVHNGKSKILACKEFSVSSNIAEYFFMNTTHIINVEFYVAVCGWNAGFCVAILPSFEIFFNLSTITKNGFL